METKQTQGMLVNYNGCNDGVMEWASTSEFPESPYGYLTWVNTAGDFYPGADTHWAFGRGAGGAYLLWNKQNGIVFAAIGLTNDAGYNPTSYGIPQIIEANILGPNPLFEGGPIPTTTPTPAITATPTSTPPSTATPTQALTQRITSTPPPTQTPLTSPSPTNPPAPTATSTAVAGASVNVSDLEGFAYELPGSLTWSADVSIVVEDQNGQPLQNVSVTGSWSGGDPASASCTSDLSGQ